MPRLLAALLLWGALALTAGNRAAADVSSASLGLNRCTVVAAVMVDSVDSANARPGDFFRFETLNAVMAGKRVVIPPRTMGYGIVSIASPAGRAGRAGTLVLEPRYLVLPDGHRLGVVLDHHSSDMQAAGKSNDMPGYLGAIPVPGLGAAIASSITSIMARTSAYPRARCSRFFPATIPRYSAANRTRLTEPSRPRVRWACSCGRWRAR